MTPAWQPSGSPKRWVTLDNAGAAGGLGQWWKQHASFLATAFCAAAVSGAHNSNSAASLSPCFPSVQLMWCARLCASLRHARWPSTHRCEPSIDRCLHCPECCCCCAVALCLLHDNHSHCTSWSTHACLLEWNQTSTQAVEFVEDQQLLWDAPDIRLTNKQHLRVAAYLAKVIERVWVWLL